MAASFPSSYLLNLFLRWNPPPHSPSFISLLKPLLISSTTLCSSSCLLQFSAISTTHLSSRPAHLCHSLSHSATLSVAPAVSSSVGLPPEFEEDDEEEEGDYDGDEEEAEIENGCDKLEIEGNVADESKIGADGESLPLERSGVKLPSLTVKEKKELASYAHSLGKKLKSQLVGKSGVTPNVASSFIETLEANELLKIKIHRTCPGDLEDVVKQLEEATGSVVVGQIGRTVIVFRPSLTKLKAEEKRKQARKIFVRQPKVKHTLLNKGQATRLSNRGRRGSSGAS